MSEENDTGVATGWVHPQKGVKVNILPSEKILTLSNFKSALPYMERLMSLA